MHHFTGGNKQVDYLKGNIISVSTVSSYSGKAEYCCWFWQPM